MYSKTHRKLKKVKKRVENITEDKIIFSDQN